MYVNNWAMDGYPNDVPAGCWDNPEALNGAKHGYLTMSLSWSQTSFDWRPSMVATVTAASPSCFAGKVGM